MFRDDLTVADVLTNFNGPNYHGIQHLVSRTETPLKSFIIGAQGGLGMGGVIVGRMTAKHREIEWQRFGIRTPSATRQRPDAFKNLVPEQHKAEPVSNVIQTHTEAYEVGWEKMAQTEQFDGINVGQGPNPVQDPLGREGFLKMAEINLDQEMSLIYSTYNKPVNAADPARMRGLMQAINTNVVDAGGQALKWSMVKDALRKSLDNGGKSIGEGLTLFCNSGPIDQVSEEIEAKEGLQPRDREVYGVNVRTFLTPFGPVNFVYHHLMEQTDALILNGMHLRLWHRFVPPHDDIPGGITFTYRVARTGNTTERAIYSSITLEYGNEAAHCKIINLREDS